MKIHIILERESRVPLYIQIYEAYRESILEGVLGAGTRLESIVQLKQSLCVSRNTVEMAYLQLSVEGFIYSRRGSGYYVSQLDNYEHLNYTEGRSRKLLQSQERGSSARYDFDPGSTDYEHFPFKRWNRIEQEVMSPENRGVLTYPDPRGEEELRIQICSYLKHSRGVKCRPEQILVGAGIQPLIGVICHLLGGEGRAALEDPGYPAIRKAFEWNRWEVVPVKLRDNVMDVSRIIEGEEDPDLVYLTPSNQHPMGGLLNAPDKLSLLKWARDRKVYLVEDDYDSEFRYKTHPVPTIYSLDRFQRVIYLGTFSKTLFPAMRISYMVLPEELAEGFGEMEACYNQTASKIHQLTLAEFMREGLYDQHIRRMRTLYGRKHGRMVEVIEEVFGRRASIMGDHSGINFALRIHLPISEEEIVERAAEAGVRIYPVSLYEIEERESRGYTDILLGYGHMNLEEIEDAVRLLGEALL